jgi:hypothetical protein
MDFSLILPSRERPNLLRGFLESVRSTADHPERLEVIVATDDDDAATQEVTPVLSEVFPFVTFWTRDRADNLHIGYYNPMAVEMASGRYVWVLNDDAVVVTPHWDTLALAHFELCPVDGLWYGHGPDSLKQHFGMFPLLPMQAVQALGYVLHPGFRAWGADENLYDIWHNVGRVFYCPMLRTDHLAHHHGTRERDGVNMRMGHLSKESNINAPTEMAKEEAARIRKLIA